MNEHVGNSEPDKQYNAELVFSFSLYMYHSYIFSFKESTTVTKDKEQNEYNKKIYSNVEDKSLPIVSD